MGWHLTKIPDFTQFFTHTWTFSYSIWPKNTWIFSTVVAYFLLPLCETEHRGVHAIPLSWSLAESHISGCKFFGILLNMLRISATQIYDSRNLITFATNLFMIRPHHPTFYKMQSDIKFHSSSAEWSDTEQKNNEALFSLQSNLLPVTCRSGMNSCQTLLFRPFWLKHSFFSLAEDGPSPLPMTAVQNSENSLRYGQVFAVQEPNQYTGVGYAGEVIQ